MADVRFDLVLPEGLKGALREQAGLRRRSLTAEIVHRLEESLAATAFVAANDRLQQPQILGLDVPVERYDRIMGGRVSEEEALAAQKRREEALRADPDYDKDPPLPYEAQPVKIPEMQPGPPSPLTEAMKAADERKQQPVEVIHKGEKIGRVTPVPKRKQRTEMCVHRLRPAQYCRECDA